MLPPMSMRRPIGSASPKLVLAKSSLTTATGSVPWRSRSVISRPRTIGICMVVKNRGPVHRTRVPSRRPPVDRDRVRAAGPDERGMRQRHVAHARHLAQATPQIGIEVGDSGLRIAGLRRVQLEQQHVVAVEPERYRLEIRERPDEQACRDQQQERGRDLRHHQHLRQARACGAQPRARLADRSIPEPRHQRRTGRLQRRRQAEQHAAHQRQRQRDEQHVPIQFGVERERLLAVGEPAASTRACRRRR